MIQAHIDDIRDENVWTASTDKMGTEKALLAKVSRNWGHVIETLEEAS